LALEKAGKYAGAALYYQRALRGLQEVWISFWHYGDPGKAHKVMQQLVGEYQDRLKTCVRKAKMGEAEREHMEAVNELWMGEYVDQELGGYKLAFAYRAEEAEKHGDFLFAEKLRLAAADYCRLVAVPYHERLASKIEARQQRGEAALHREAAARYKRQAAEHEIVARGNKLLASLPGLQGPRSAPDARLLQEHYFKSYVLYHQRVLAVKGGKWTTGRTPEQVAAILEQKGLRHADESARFTAVVVLANLGEREAMLTALADRSPRVRQAAARALAASRWARGWAACFRHPDPKIREAVAPLLEPAEEHVLSRTTSITELLRGLESRSAGTRTFCHTAMQRITGKREMPASTWRSWWEGLGDAKPGLSRAGPDGSAIRDETIDIGTWWESGERSIRARPNPLLAYPLPARIQWRGHLVVARPGSYRFYVRSRGEKRSAFDQYGILYFTPPCAKLHIDGAPLLPNPSCAVEDAKMHMRIDSSQPIALKPGLHTVLLELEVKSVGTGPWQGPSVRLYWSSEEFLRQLVPVDHLISRD
jgi:hypothetical protein